MLFLCTLPMEPMGKQRPRIAQRGRYARTYTPAKTAQWESDAAKVLSAFWRLPPIEQPVIVYFTAYRKRPKSMCTKSKSAIQICAVKPDLDNVCKIVLDSLVKAGVLKDDNIVCELICRKLWADPGEPGRIELAIDRAGVLQRPWVGERPNGSATRN
jgi:Holliday junction resolvase RusA-like endonuclease